MHLKKAIQEVYDGNRFISPLLEPALSKQRNLDINEYDIQLMRLLSFGYSQDEIRKELQETNITPNSLSAIEKRLNGLKNKFGASNRVPYFADEGFGVNISCK